jgi:hypothetical protein
MNKFRIEVNEVKYVCKSDGTGKTKGPTENIGQEVIIRGFLEMRGRRFIVQELNEFDGSPMIEVMIPKSVENVRECCFSGCPSLCAVQFDSNCLSH